MFPRLQTPPVKTVLLTTLYCAVAGGLAQLLMAFNMTDDIGFYGAPILFSIAVLISFRITVRLTIIRLIGMPVVLLGIYIGWIMLMNLSTGLQHDFSDASPWVFGILGWLVWSLPGMATVLAIGLLLRARVRPLNILIGGICSSLSCFLAFEISYSNSWLDIGPIFLYWQTLVGFSVGLINTGTRSPGNAPAPRVIVPRQGE